MSDSDPPPDTVPPPSPSEGRESRRRRLEGVIPEIVRRAVELGVEKARESPDSLKQFVGDLRLPKDIAHYLLQQIDETKNGLFRVVAKEIRDFLEHTNFAGEMQKILTTVQFEVNTTIRFTPNDGRDKGKKDEAAPGTESDEDESDEPSEGPTEASASSGSKDERTSTLPKPEVKTAVNIRRDERERRRRARND
ncbi:putative protease [Labilithrix luteola]|uniref:Putative protease n=1 Tax=Labilithrix luteola TaxID=1391654 RepID=A0A0K1QAU1_9BACT|nr:hypothetical protein [Labilithrix luteola]AKV02540.1 putative protease [Labilithrix luteola]